MVLLDRFYIIIILTRLLLNTYIEIKKNKLKKKKEKKKREHEVTVALTVDSFK